MQPGKQHYNRQNIIVYCKSQLTLVLSLRYGSIVRIVAYGTSRTMPIRVDSLDYSIQHNTHLGE
jgi:hypothetical protein